MQKKEFSDLKIALVCDWLTNQGGAEHVMWAMHEAFPESPIYTSIYHAPALPKFQTCDIRTSFLQKMPFSRKHHQWYISLMPYAFEEFDFSEYDVVISSCHSCAKGIITKPETVHISYCHTPMRYAWDESHKYIQDSHFPGFMKKWYIPMALKKLRTWDRLAADRVDYFLANSSFIRQRIKKYYSHESDVLHPPVDISRFTVNEKPGSYFLALGRLIPYKKFDLIVETFNTLGLPLKIVGTGPEYARLKQIAKPNIEFLGFVPENDIPKLYHEAQALLFPQLEDFGIVAVEAMASGRPVIAYKKGGALDTVIENVTGVFFEEQTMESLADAVTRFNQTSFDPDIIRKHAEIFDVEVFKKNLQKIVVEKYDLWQQTLKKL